MLTELPAPDASFEPSAEKAKHWIGCPSCNRTVPNRRTAPQGSGSPNESKSPFAVVWPLADPISTPAARSVTYRARNHRPIRAHLIMATPALKVPQQAAGNRREPPCNVIADNHKTAVSSVNVGRHSEEARTNGSSRRTATRIFVDPWNGLWAASDCAFNNPGQRVRFLGLKNPSLSVLPSVVA